MALDSLAKQLASVVTSFGLPALQLGHPEVVREASEQAARVFQGCAKALPSKEDAYAAALAFMRGHSLDERQVDLVASALSERIREQNNARALGHRKLPDLLDAYARDAQAGNLWRLTWFGLLGSYFAFDPDKAGEEEDTGWGRLRAFLERTWPLIDRQSGNGVVPDWVRVVRGDPGLLSDKAAHRYALDYMRGDESAVKRLGQDLGIPESSWFWQALVLGAVRRSSEQSDTAFKTSIPRLLALLQLRPVFRDDALEILLTRYHACADREMHRELRDYVVRRDVWRNPKLRAAGMATAWNRVRDDVWRMVLQWVNEANLKDFFAVLAARRSADEGRLEFWSQYMEQISWTRLIFSVQTRALAHSSDAIRSLIAREEDSYATMGSYADVDAFMMQVGNYMIVEFSKVPNAAYVYKVDELQFDLYAREYTGTTEDLKRGFRGAKAARFTHQQGWEREAAWELRRLGIHPDKVTRVEQKVEAPAPPPPAVGPLHRYPGFGPEPRGAPFTMQSLEEVVSAYPGARVRDMRGIASGDLSMCGALWVEDAQIHDSLATTLRTWGFRWSPQRGLYWYVGDDARLHQGESQQTRAAVEHERSGAAGRRHARDSDGAPAGAQFTMLFLRSLIAGHPGVVIDDRRGASGGRLWVQDPKQRIGIGNELKRLGFRWAATRQAWYYPET